MAAASLVPPLAGTHPAIWLPNAHCTSIKKAGQGPIVHFAIASCKLQYFRTWSRNSQEFTNHYGSVGYDFGLADGMRRAQ